jgi:Phycobilisome protein
MTTLPVFPSVRLDPVLGEVFRVAESMFFDDAQLAAILEARPDLALPVEAARLMREHVEEVIEEVVVKQTWEEYPWEEFGLTKEKGPRDNRTILAYVSHAIVAQDPQWLDDRVLIWCKTILQSFDFPDRVRIVVPLDAETEAKRLSLPVKVRAIFQNWTRIRQEFERRLPPGPYAAAQPYLQQVIDTLTEDY